MTATMSVRRHQWPGPWPVGACCSRSLIRPNAASSPRPAGRCSWTHRNGGTGSGRRGFSEYETPDLIAAIETAIDQAEALLGHTLIEDCVTTDGVLEPLAIVTDNGAAMRSVSLARWFDDRPHLAHVRTRHRSPQANGVIERFFQSIKYEHLYRHEIGDGDTLADHVAGYLTTYNQTRPHEAINWQRPENRYLTTPKQPPPSNPQTPKPEQDS